MVCSVTDVMRTLECCDIKGYNKLKDVIDRNIPIEGFQANMMYLNRGYGKSWMSYILVAQQCMEILDNHKEVTVGSRCAVVDPAYYDIDIGTNHRRMQIWLETFMEFIEEYYPDMKINELSSTSYYLTIERS